MFAHFEHSETILIAIALSTVVLVFAVMLFRRNAPTEILFTAALGLYVLCGVIAPDKAWRSFSDPAVISIAGLLIISAALRTSGALDSAGRLLLGNVQSETVALCRLSFVLILGSAFLLNTAIVAMLLPLVIGWCRRRGIAASKLLLPVSYLAILGGTCTLLGTSTNFVVNGELRSVVAALDDPALARQLEAESEATEAASAIGTPEPPTAPEAKRQGILAGYPVAWLVKYRDQLQPMGLTDISRVGVPCALAGALLLIAFGRRLLPDRTEMLDSLEDKRREYLVEMMVTSTCGLIGKTVEEGGLRHLPGLFLIEIDRAGEVITPVAPTDRIHENDRLVFTGVVATIVDIEKIPGLVPAADINYEISPDQAASRTLVEVVLSPSSPLVGSTIRKANFRQHYGAAVVAVHRNGERLPTKIGDIKLSAGDTLLLQTQKSFIRSFRNRPDFYLVSGVEDSDSRRHDKMWLAIGITLALIVLLFTMPFFPIMLASTYGENIPAVLQSIPFAIVATALLLILTRCLSVADARAAIDLPMLLTVGAAIGVGRAISECGADKLLASWIISAAGDNPYLGLAIIFFATVCLTEMISNVAVAAMMFYVAIGFASQLGVNPRPFIMAVTMAASLSFISPIGYQTNLMVMGPGSYRPLDYVRAGLPLSIVVGLCAVILIPLIWGF